ncbi:hypothetical protein DW039_16630, partial [Bacteroides sp. AF39-16AC]
GGTRFKCYPGPFSSVSYKPAQEYRKVNSRHTCFSRPHRQFPNGLNGEQELSPCFPTCKSSSLSSPPAGRSFLSFQ